MSHKIKFGIIGCGTISNWYAEAMAKMERAELSCVYDVHPQSAKAFAEKYSTKYYLKLEEFLAADAEAVCICTPSGLHAQYVVAAADAGKNIVVEKPMGITAEQLDEIVDACDRNHVKLCAISQLLFSDGLLKIKSALDSNKLGRIILGDVVMKYFRSDEYYRAGGWRGTKRMDGGGALMNQGIHGVSLLLYLMGPVKSVTALSKTLVHPIEVEDTAAALLEFQSGALGYLVSTTSVTPGMPRILNIHGTKGSITLTEDTITQWDIEGEPQQQQQTGRLQQDTANDPAGFSAEYHKRQLNDFIDAIESNGKPRFDQNEGRKPVDLILAIYRSAETGKTVSVE